MTMLMNGREDDSVLSTDRGLLYGDGVFETIALRDGRPLLWERHMERLVEGCARLAIPRPDARQLLAEVERLADGSGRAVAKIVVTRGAGGRGYRPDATEPPTRIVQRHPWPVYPADAAQRGVALRWCATRLARQPRLSGIKHLNRLEQVLARAEWRDEYGEGLMRDTEELVIEATTSNLFLVSRGVLITPDLSQSGVAGVMRAETLALAGALGIPTAIRPVTAPEVEEADELFLTNSLIGLWPVARLETRHYEVAGKITQALQAALRAAGCLASE